MNVEILDRTTDENPNLRAHIALRLAGIRSSCQVHFKGSDPLHRIGSLLFESLAESKSTFVVSSELAEQLSENTGLRDAFDTSVVDRILATAAQGSLSEAEEITLWEYSRRLRDVAEFQTQRSRLDQASGEIVNDIVSKLERIHSFIADQEDPVDFDLLRTGLQSTFTSAAGTSTCRSREAFEFAFLNSFGLLLAGRLHASQTFWKVILLNISYVLRDRVGRNGSHILADAIDTLVDAVPRFEMIQGLIEVLDGCDIETEVVPGSATPASLLCWRILVAQDPSSDLNQRWVSLFSAGDTSILPTEPCRELENITEGVRHDLLERFERFYVDWFDEASQFLSRSSNIRLEIAREIESIEPQLQKIAEDLSAGLRGADPVRVFSDILHSVVYSAYFFASLSGNSAIARRLFRRSLVVEMGFHPKEDFWRKYRQFCASLINLLESRPQWAGSIQLLRSIENIDRDFRDYPFRGLTPVGEMVNLQQLDPSGDPVFKEKADRDLNYLLKRLGVDRRIQPGDIAGWTTARWYADEVLYYLPESQLPNAAFSSLMDRLEAALAEESRSGDKAVTPQLVEAFADFVSQVPRVTSSLRLTRGAEKIATAATEYVFEQLPDYAELVGERGKHSAIRDNTLTLLQLARFNLGEQSEPMEQLNLWWNAVVNSYIENRPEGLFEQNLNGIYFALASHLSRAEVNCVFPLIEGVYQESLGIRSLASRGGDCLVLDGPHWRRILGRKRPGILGERIATVPAALDALLDQVDGEEKDTLIVARDIFSRASKSLGENGDLEAALAQTFPMIDQALESGMGADALASAVRYWADNGLFYSDSALALIMPELGRDLGLAVGQVGFGRKLSAMAAEIADHFSQNIVAFDPESFPPEAAQSSHRKGTRDQTLFLQAWGNSLRNQPLSLSFINGTRYFLEMLSPYVSYPERVWRLAARTVSKRLIGELDRIEAYVMSAVTDQWEAMCAELSETHEMATSAFAADDYSFSPRMGEDRAMRSLVGGIVAAAATPDGYLLKPEAILERLALATSLPAISGWERVETLLDELPVQLGQVSPGIEESIRILRDKLAKVREYEEGDHSQFRASYDLLRSIPGQDKVFFLVGYRVIAESEAFQEWWKEASPVVSTRPDQMRQIAESASEIEATLAKSIGTDDTLNLISRVSLRNWTVFALEHGDEAFPGSITTDILADAYEFGDSGGWNLEKGITALEGTQLPRGFLDCLRLVNAHSSRLEVGARCFQDAAKMASALTRDFFGKASSMPGSVKSGHCDADTNRQAFQQIFAHLGIGMIRTTVKAPRMFFGTTGENLEFFDRKVVSNAFAAISATARGLVPPSGNSFLDHALVDVVFDSLPPSGKNWCSVFEGGKKSRPRAVLARLRESLPGLTQALSNRNGSLSPREHGALVDELGAHLSLFLSCLESFGDPDQGWVELIPVLSRSCTQRGVENLLKIYHDAFHFAETAVAPALAPIWRLFIQRGIYMVENIALARELSLRMDEMAREIPDRFAKSGASEASGQGPNPQKCSRDQLLVIQTLVANLTRYPGPVAASETLRFLLETTVGNLPYDTEGMQMLWRVQEDYLVEKLPAHLTFPALKWMGLFQKALALLPGLRGLGTVIPQSLRDVSRIRAADRTAASALIETLALAQLVDDGNPDARLFAIGGAILRVSPSVSGAPADWPSRSEKLEKAISARIETTIPGFALQGLAGAHGFLQTLEHLRGDATGLGAYCAFYGQTGAARALWMADSLATCNDDGISSIERSGSTAIAMVSGLEIPIERELKTMIGQIRETVGLLENVDLNAVELPLKSEGALGRLFKRKPKPNPLADSPETIRLLEYAVRRINHDHLLGLANGQRLEARLCELCYALSSACPGFLDSPADLKDLVERVRHHLRFERGDENVAFQHIAAITDAVPVVLLANHWIHSGNGPASRSAALVALGLLGESNLNLYLRSDAGSEAIPEHDAVLNPAANEIFRTLSTYARRSGITSPFKVSA